VDRITFVSGLKTTRKLARGFHLYRGGVRKPAQNCSGGNPVKMAFLISAHDVRKRVVF